jgi:hypothetical protein
MKKLLLTLLLVCSSLAIRARGQDTVIQNNFYYSRADIGRQLPAGTTYNQISLSWVVNGQISTCSASAGCVLVGSANCMVEVDTSPDNSTWTPLLGGACAYPMLTSSAGKGPNFTITGGNYIRVNVTALSGASGPASLATTLKLWSSAY